MPSTRRGFLTGSGVVVASLSGCANFGSSTPCIAKLAVTLENRTSEDQVFHFAVETSEELREWVTQTVASNTSEAVVREPDEKFEPVAIHGVVDTRTVRGDLLSSSEAGTRKICLRITFRCSAATEPTFLQDTDIRC
ncbi:hypothetical protein [Haloarcula argentinensis]|uniref:Lipoprotein n=1 Tax=Haloarcula argentinensis TaxID=43776 RepID=A0ABU2EVU6_HALAR|nr:hypothetical protein [Haloarcula argentinensis]MDS0252382.1 hypothetical protein [Haloarcula argentinensis]